MAALVSFPPTLPLAAPRLYEAIPFSRKSLHEKAKDLAQKPYRPPSDIIPTVFRDMSYDAYRDIRFRPPESLWAGPGPFSAQFFHPGLFFQHPVTIHEVAEGRAQEIAFSPHLFSYGPQAESYQSYADELSGFAGLRLHYPLNRPDIIDELAVFLGASYFRSLGKGQVYGLSARGIAVNTGESEGEEFPAFREFWLERPYPNNPKSNSITLHCLLDGPSLSGIYTFEIAPGSTTVMTCEVALYARTDIKKIGIAPLTSMYTFGAMDANANDDFRSQVHDSEGLALWLETGERLWRPLENPESLRITRFVSGNFLGFGLLQRQRDFDVYQDLEARYDKRPSLWVEPMGSWGEGSVELVEIPAKEEIMDNIVAYFVPDTPLSAGDQWQGRYKLYWGENSPAFHTTGFANRSMSGKAGIPGMARPQNSRKFVIDFVGGQLDDPDLRHETDAPLKVSLSIDQGKTSKPSLVYNPAKGGWRVAFDVYGKQGEVSEIRCFLKRGQHAVSETWSYAWSAP